MRKIEEPKFEKKIVKTKFKFIPEIAIHYFTLPDGTIGEWDSIFTDKTTTVLVVPMTPEGKIVLVKLFRFPVENFCIEFPGGDAEKGEPLADAAQRELLEETGYVSDQPLAELCRGHLFNARTDGSFVIFLARKCRKVSEPTPDLVEKFTGIRTVELESRDIINSIANGDAAYDLTISHALVTLILKGLIKIN